MARERFVIPLSMVPEAGIAEVRGRDGKRYLLQNEVMFTGLRHSRGEHSEFFLALRDECRILAHRCPECGTVIVPPFMARCDACNFATMVKEYVKDTGVMAYSPVITMFAPSRFKDQVPFATGRVFLETGSGSLTDTAMLLRARTTTGAIRPRIFKKDTPVKVVFSDARRGEILDVFVVPQAELTSQEIAKSPLFESDLKWERVAQAELGPVQPGEHVELEEVLQAFRALAEKVARSVRAAADLTHWKRLVKVSLPSGEFHFLLDNGRLEVQQEADGQPDLILTVVHPSALLAWLRDSVKTTELTSAPLTDLVMEGTIRLNKTEMETITRLDRLPRSLRRETA